MPYKTMSDVNAAIKGIRPKVNLEQANVIASMADSNEKEGSAENAWAAAIGSFKKAYTVRKGAWVKREDAKKPPAQEAEPEALASENGYEMEYKPTYGARSFDELDRMREASEATQEIRERTDDFTAMLSNILYGEDANKISSMQSLFGEYVARIEGILSGETMESADVESATLSECFSADVTDFVALEESDKNNLVTMNVKIIRPGWGNTRDNNFYPVDVLKRDVDKFVGAKMYESDHRSEEKSTRTWVSTIKEIKSFADDGAPIATVVVHDPNFAERVKNLNSADMLTKMECSIYGSAKSKNGYEQGGRKGRLIESITDIQSVDWVTRAGAGGHAINLQEDGGLVNGMQEEDKKEVAEQAPAEDTQIKINEQQKPDAEEPVKLSEHDVKEKLQSAKLPEKAKSRLALAEYDSEDALQEAIQHEVEYIAEITGSGSVTDLGETQKPQNKKLSIAEREALIDKANKKYLG
jgi:hypothetical protein